jgi:hypothetical protein
VAPKFACEFSCLGGIAGKSDAKRRVLIRQLHQPLRCAVGVKSQRIGIPGDPGQPLAVLQAGLLSGQHPAGFNMGGKSAPVGMANEHGIGIYDSRSLTLEMGGHPKSYDAIVHEGGVRWGK